MAPPRRPPCACGLSGVTSLSHASALSWSCSYSTLDWREFCLALSRGQRAGFRARREGVFGRLLARQRRRMGMGMGMGTPLELAYG